MSRSIDSLRLRAVMGRDRWSPPREFGVPSDGGWILTSIDQLGSVIASVARYDDGIEWAHASIARADRMPDYEDLKRLHRAVWGDTGWAVQIFAPKTEHVNIHPRALHLWGRLDGKPFVRDFGILPDGTRSI